MSETWLEPYTKYIQALQLPQFWEEHLWNYTGDSNKNRREQFYDFHVYKAFFLPI